ncbi:PAXNEB-domain-containing protein [Eremomyces bilateralis CBS 781.70]|uniref:Elongator complex protein 4 n=1 Tax=Eremomyces bilateralis CBS 781.70 TaxID=1392243 RepID=A0A6G1FXK0_9PEZI|nr:PAXNEB-domain-containing protein [Eremomyces bilateralis CBS 781.70]KAF1810478.1 PAXNEB-domain-containing protein [Eremomyces bilateralis CBS 781.70]
MANLDHLAPTDREGLKTKGEPPKEGISTFCHSFDLAKRLDVGLRSRFQFIPLRGVGDTQSSPFLSAFLTLEKYLLSSAPTSVHRVVIPSLLSPALYPPHACAPHHVLQFLMNIRRLLRSIPSRLAVMTTFPLSLFPRNQGVVRWMEILSDCVLELAPFPHQSLASSGATTKDEEAPQGLMRIHKLPTLHERGGASAAQLLAEDLAFVVSRRKVVIKPFSLPPIEGDQEAQSEREGGHTQGGGLSF